MEILLDVKCLFYDYQKHTDGLYRFVTTREEYMEKIKKFTIHCI